MSTQRVKERKCVLVPAYQQEATIGPLIGKIRACVDDVVVVDDGSTDDTVTRAREAGATVVEHFCNKGKGAALNTGFREVRAKGCDSVVCLDGDGRHDPKDIPRFLAAYERTGIPVLVGNRMGESAAAIPCAERMANRLTSWLLYRFMGQYVPDTRCGFRFYRCDVLPFVEAHDSRFAAEIEVLLHAAERGIRVGAVPVKEGTAGKHSGATVVGDVWRFLVILWHHFRRRRERRSEW